ncbi:CKLF-like MARVEL transmembrane domain-containing protein 8b isoform X3 [Oryzias melastigma]|uniref:CKLF-like MARVEL transmembrane domain containing 8b n=1 Tax=Oryzias melastigma TaxID=30732 RepID=A0A3B3CB18_ORYME|nr:CKLF-like MARVEL transmembrane domain-containing protein 8b isoform X3 [Oryzias melastigma]
MEPPTAASTRRGPSSPQHNTSTSTLAFDQHFTSTAKGILLLSEIVCGMLVWILVGGTDYFHLPALSWVMFVAIVFWILTVCLFIIYLTRAHYRLPQIPWTTLVTCTKLTIIEIHVKSYMTKCCFFQSVCFDCSATALYLVTAVVDALSVNQAIRGRHNYNCWAASAFFAFLTTLCYAASSWLSLHAWKNSEEEQ